MQEEVLEAVISKAPLITERMQMNLNIIREILLLEDMDQILLHMNQPLIILIKITLLIKQKIKIELMKVHIMINRWIMYYLIIEKYLKFSLFKIK